MAASYSTASTVLDAIDISKHRHEVLIGKPGKTRRRRMTFTNTLEDSLRLSTALGWQTPAEFAETFTPQRGLTLCQPQSSAPGPSCEPQTAENATTQIQIFAHEG